METKQPGAMSAQEAHEVLYDGADLEVLYKAGHLGLVKVRKIPREEFANLALIIQDDSELGEFQEAALYCGRDEAWARSLHEGSLDRVLAEGQRLNFSSYARWFRRRARMVSLVSNQEALVAAASEAMTRLTQRGFTNGSSARGTGTPSSGNIPPRN